MNQLATATFALLVCISLAGCSAAPEPEARETSPPADRPAASARETAVSATPAAAPTGAAKPAKPTLDELLLFQPAKFPAGDWQPTGVTFEDVWFTADDGTRLHAWYCPCERPRAVLLYAHGNAGNLSYDAPLLKYLQQKLRVTALVFDYCGYGRSAGTPTADGILRDARAARTLLARRAGVKVTAVVLMGRSLGGAVVVHLAAETPPRGLILESTFSSLQEVASHHYPRLAWLVPAGKLDSRSQLARYKGPLLQSHGDSDQTIPYSQGQKLFEAAPGRKRFVTIPGGDHNDPQSAAYYRELDRFLDSLPP
jgi:fermentation-respiration switch protein FrsA (DUF1100 family)